MTDMPETPAHARPRAWTGGHKFLAAVLILLGTAIAAMAFAEIFVNVTGLLHPSMGHWAGIVPVSGEIAYAFMFGCGFLLLLRRAPGTPLRAVVMAVLMAASVPLNIWNYRQSLPAALGHLLPVAAFFGCMLVGKGVVMALRGGKVRADRISGGEWTAHPLRSLSLWRWMTTWGEPSRKVAQARYMALLFAIAIAQADPRVGRRWFTWRRRLPVTLRYQLDTGTFPADVRDAIDTGDGTWQDQVEAWVTAALTRGDKTRANMRRERDAIEHATMPDSHPPASPPATTGEVVATSPEPRQEDRQPPRQSARQKSASDRAKARAKATRLLSATPPPTLTEVAEQTGLSERTVSRIKSEMPIPIDRAARG